MADTEKVKSFLGWLLNYAASRRRGFVAVLLTLLAFSLIMVLVKGEYSGNLADFFEPQSEAGKTFAVMERAGLTRRMVIEFDFSPLEVDKKLLENACHKLLKLEGVRRVDYQFGTDSVATFLGMGDVIFSYAFTPEEAIPSDPEATAQNLLLRLMNPGVPASMVLLDPWGLNTRLLGKLSLFYQLSGLEIMPGEEFIIHPDGQKALAMLDLSVSSAEVKAAKKLLDDIDLAMSEYHGTFAYHIFSSHLHTVANEQTLKADVTRVGIISALALLLLFFVVYRRDYSSLFIVLLPFGATLITTGLIFIFAPKIILFVVGMGGAIVGLAVDYGIHIYAARRERDSLTKIAALGLPLLAGCLTTSGVFLLLGFINIAAYRQLGIFAGLALLISLVLAYLYLPLLIKEKPIVVKTANSSTTGSKVAPIVVWLIFAFCAIYFARNSTFNFGVAEFDGTGREVMELERRFECTWRPRGTPAMLTIIRDNKEKLLEDMEIISARFSKLAPEADTFVVTDIYSSSAKRHNVLALWRNYQDSGRLDAEEENWAKAANKVGSSKNFFTPFFNRLRESIAQEQTNYVTPSIFFQLVKVNDSCASTSLFFPDKIEYLNLARKLVDDDPDGAVISSAFEQAIGGDLGARLRWLIPVAALVIIVVVGVFMRSLWRTTIALLPVVSSWLGIAGLFGLFDVALNLPILISSLLLTGLAIDYGIFGVYSRRNPESNSIKMAMKMSFLTTFLGVGSLVFSRHPVMFYTGVTLGAGMLIAFLTGFFVVPVLTGKCESFKNLVVLVSLAALLGLSGCYFAPNKVVEAARASALETLRIENKIPHTPYIVQGKMVFKSRLGDFSSLFVARLDEAKRLVQLSGISPTGNLIYEISGTPGEPGIEAKLDKWSFSPALDFGKYEHYKEFVAAELLQATGDIYFNNTPLEGESKVGKDYFGLIRKTCDGLNLSYRFTGHPMQLVEKKHYGFWRTYWTLQIDELYYFDFGGKTIKRGSYRSRHYQIEFENHAFIRDINNNE